MRRTPAIAVLVIVRSLGAAACGDDQAAPEEIELIGLDWTISPGEQYKCLGVIAERDMFISGFENIAPLGEHHALVTIGDEPGGYGGTRLGEYDCGVATVDLEMLFASGLGEGQIALPDGVALKIEAGQFLHLNLHLFNATNDVITARSSVHATLVPNVPPEKEAEMVFVGTTAIGILPGDTGTVGGGCDFTRDAQVFAYWPHMHQYGTHQKVTMTVGGVERVVHDAAFDFTHQTTYAVDPLIAVQPGDSIRTECTYTNPSAETLTWGDSSTQEMCFTGLYRYPKQAYSLFECTEGRP